MDKDHAEAFEDLQVLQELYSVTRDQDEVPLHLLIKAPRSAFRGGRLLVSRGAGYVCVISFTSRQRKRATSFLAAWRSRMKTEERKGSLVELQQWLRECAVQQGIM